MDKDSCGWSTASLENPAESSSISNFGNEISKFISHYGQ